MGIFRVKQQKIMSRYYFNENPQVTEWRMKCEKLQKELDALKTAFEIQKCDAEFRIYSMEGTDKYYQERLKEFNRLPWWKKMFYRFWV